MALTEEERREQWRANYHRRKANHPEKLAQERRETSRRYRERHPDKVREQYQSWRGKNREKLLAYNRNWYALNKDKVLLAKTRRMYGIDLAEWLERQEGKCAICRSPFESRPTVDHDHSCCPGQGSCGKCVRGLLCTNCNTGIGLLKEDPDIFASALSYLNGGRRGAE